MRAAIFALAAGVCFAPPASAEDIYDKCIQDSDGTNTAWAQCGGALVERSDKALNDAWKKLKGSFGDEAVERALLEEQRAWNDFKEKSCRFYATGYFGREGQVLEYPACRAAIIDARTATLRGYLGEASRQ